MLLFYFMACLGMPKKSIPQAKSEPMGILSILDRSAENIRYVGQGQCQPKSSFKLFVTAPARLMFFESDIGAVIATVSCSGKDIFFLDIHPKTSKLYYKIHYGEWGIVGYLKKEGVWNDVCEHSECRKYLSTREQELWQRDYKDFNEVLKSTYVLRSRIPIP